MEQGIERQTEEETETQEERKKEIEKKKDLYIRILYIISL